MPALRSIADQIALMRAAAEPLPAEQVPAREALGRVLAEPIVARFAVPPFTNTAMDGYAVRTADLDGLPDDALELPVAGDAPAGAAPAVLPTGAAMRIMTGAPLPEGADAVIPVERTDQRPGPGPVPDRIRIEERPAVGAHLRHRGEDVEPGALVLEAGRRLDPLAIGAALSVGAAEPLVHRRPRVVVISTGDELAQFDPEAPLAPGMIPDSNGPMLAALLAELGVDAVRVPATSDSVEEFMAALEAAADGADLVVTSGGVSAGAFEVVRQALEPRGVEFTGIAMQPGKPQGFGAIDLGGRRVLVACLPGNPVSVFVSTHVLLRPLLGRFTGEEAALAPVRAVAAHDWSSPRGRVQYAPAMLSQRADGRLEVRLPNPIGAKSHLIASLHHANCLAMVALGVDAVRAGDELDVLQLAPLH